MPRKIRVLLVSHTMDRGGLEQAVLTIAGGLNKDRFEVHVAYFVGGAAAERLKALTGVHPVHLTPRSRAMRLLALYRLVRDLRPDLLHNHFCWYGLTAGTIAGVRRVETVHNIYRWFNLGQRVAYSVHCLLAHRMVAVSAAVREYTCRRFPVARMKQWTVIHNGIDPVRFQRTGGHELRSSLGLRPENVVVGFSGRFEREKGVGLLLKTAEMIDRVNPEVRFLLAGSGSLDAEIRESCIQRGITNVIIAGFRDDVAALYSVFDMIVFPSLYEGLPLALLEAMAAACPVVAFRVGGIPEAVEDGVEGYLVEPGAVGDLVGRIRFLAGDREKRLAMGRAAASRVNARFRVAEMISKTEGVYADLMKETVP